MIVGIHKRAQALIRRVWPIEVWLTQCMIDGLVFPLQSHSTHGGYFPRWLHPGIDQEPGSGKSGPLLKGREERKIKNNNIYCTQKDMYMKRQLYTSKIRVIELVYVVMLCIIYIYI